MAKGGGRARPAHSHGFDFAEDPNLDPRNIGAPEVRAVYRMDLPCHGTAGQNVCKKNCKFNPKCLVGLGEKPWLESEDEDEDDDEELMLVDDVIRARAEQVPVGLRNLGNTCYVNSFLQIWFHNLKFRKSLYDWEPGEDPEEKDNESILDAELYEPKSKVASLQALFAMMQFTKRKFVDPQDFICKLGLNPSIQQDAQEFSKLFISLLEDALAHQKQESVRTMIQKQFRGEYAYVTTCQQCLKESIRPSHFYELDLPLSGNKTISECLEDFLKVERMTGDEKYFCENCVSKQDATRCCKLTELPPIMNLQLNRFQFDMQLGRKKKLNSAIQFPEELDMSCYLGPEVKNTKYCLTGVLMHVGPDANHGHYIAHIQDMESGNWFKFSDETVVPLQGKNNKLGLDEENTYLGSKKQQPKQPRIPKGAGVQNSNNAYMLVYMEKQTLLEIRSKEIKECSKKDAVRDAMIKQKPLKDSDYCMSNGKIFPVVFPHYLKTKIDKDNVEFEEERFERMAIKHQERQESREKHKRMARIYQSLSWEMEDSNDEELDDSFEFLPLVWVTKWLSDPSSCGEIETSHLLCQHDNLDIEKLSEVKLCDSGAVSFLYEEFGQGDGPRLDASKLCFMCVQNRARIISLEVKMARDQQFLITQKPPDDDGFWVGKRSYSRWKYLGKVALENKIVQEVADWRTKDLQARREKAMSRKRKINPIIDEKINFTELQAKLFRMGTNVSIAPAESKNRSSSVAGVSVIRNEGFTKLSNGKFENVDPDVKPKPSCAVKPIVKAKPSATVKPFIQAETIIDLVKEEKQEDVNSSSENVGGPASGPAAQSTHSGCCSESRSSSRSSSLDSDPSASGGSEMSSRETSGAETSDTASPVPPYQQPSEDDFNADLVCPHGNLRIEHKFRQLISRDSWNRLQSYFTKPITFQFGTPNCSICEDELDAANMLKEKWRETAAVQKAKLPELFKDVERPKWSKPTTKRVYLLNSGFVLAWRGFVRGLSAGKSEAVGEGITDVNNNSLLCDHEGFTFIPTITWETEPHPALVMITEEEMTIVRELFKVDVEIKVDRENLSTGPELTVTPAPCHICVASRQEAEREDKLRYNNATVFVRRILPDSDMKPGSSNNHDPEYFDSQSGTKPKLRHIYLF